MSDFHFDGKRLSETLLAKAIAASNEAEPDLVVLTGDLVNDDPIAIHNLVPWLKGLQSQYGIYAILGNHDLRYRRSRSEITQALSEIGIKVLWNEVTYPVGAGLALVGLADFWSPEFRPAPVMEQIDQNTPRIVLSHNPDTAERLRSWRVDLQLSGHTHGGQVILPGIGTPAKYLAKLYGKIPKRFKRFFPWMRSFYITVKHWNWAAGLHPIGNNHLYVNRGLGTHAPGRLFCPPEVTVITLV
ncbi:metallophosphoesterase [Kovacikia minuta]|uniref:metallophosphoesterase n=1 Tax=Kovacikia minuta TaxID=2931930 RepID=UPI0020C7CDB8